MGSKPINCPSYGYGWPLGLSSSIFSFVFCFSGRASAVNFLCSGTFLNRKEPSNESFNESFIQDFIYYSRSWPLPLLCRWAGLPLKKIQNSTVRLGPANVASTGRTCLMPESTTWSLCLQLEVRFIWPWHPLSRPFSLFASCFHVPAF